MISNLTEKMRPILEQSWTVRRVLELGGDLEDVIIALHEVNEAQFHRIAFLESIAPKKHKVSGKVVIWHCPDDLIPEEGA